MLRGDETTQTTETTEPALLDVQGLTITSEGSGRVLVDDISFSLRRGETVALVGESGSGKSLTAKAIAGLLPNGVTARGAISHRDAELLALSGRQMRGVRGSQISMLLQDPFTLLNPLYRVRTSMSETFGPVEGRSPSRADVRSEVATHLAGVGIDASAGERYPWELSGGMRQRVGLAASIIQRPGLLVADEPTTALDATTQREVLQLIRRLQCAHGMAVLIITHDLRVAMAMADRLLIMSAGRIVEVSTPEELEQGGREAYTRRLLAAELPIDERLDDLRVDLRTSDATTAVSDTDPQGSRPVPASDVPEGSVLLRVEDLRKTFASPGSRRASDAVTWALDGVSIEMRAGRSLGIIGESGSGKTTLGRCVLGLETPTSGTITIAPPAGATASDLTRAHPSLQCVFQDPYSSLNPAHTVGFTLREAIRHRGGVPSSRDEQVREVTGMLESVGLPPEVARRRPATLSGGQRQRIAIARALLLQPQVLVCDEPVAALDLTVQAQVLQVLREAQASGVSLLMITHDLSVARQMTDDLVVLYRGKIVESGTTEEVINRPRHEYTQRLLEAVPTGRREWLTEPSATT